MVTISIIWKASASFSIESLTLYLADFRFGVIPGWETGRQLDLDLQAGGWGVTGLPLLK